MEKPRVLVGMSGGVDSSVSAALLLEQGHEVIGAFMKNWSGTALGPRCRGQGSEDTTSEECDWRDERRDAMRVAAKLGISLYTFDFEEAYRARVVDPMFESYSAGQTPNPDVLCNKHIKFDLFVREADRLGCDFIATGHYAIVTTEHRIFMGTDGSKDQSYFLWAIPKKVLPRVLFPVGNTLKSDVRKKARELGLSLSEKKDSVGICFVGEVEMRSFLKQRILETPGMIETDDGRIVGTHEGLPFYTIGQREGLGVGGGGQYYVIEKRSETNTLVVGSQFHPSLYRRELMARETNWFRKPINGQRYTARVRYRQPVAGCTIELINPNGIFVRFDEPQRAVTPGQSVVVYDGQEMLGGGIIV